MCTPEIYKAMAASRNSNTSQTSGGAKVPANSMGGRLDQAQRASSSTSGGGTYGGGTILSGTPRNSGVDAQRKITMLGV